MKLSQYGYDFSADLLAKYPAENRDESRLMVVNRAKGTIEHRIFKEIIEYFDEKDLFIFNDTKVFPARLYGNKEKTGAEIEIFLLRELNRELRLWDVLVDPARKIRIGNKLYFGDDDLLVAEVIDNTTSRGRTLRFLFDGSYEEFKETLFKLGETPLPKWVREKVEPEDAERYQTIFASKEGAVAAPTAACISPSTCSNAWRSRGSKRRSSRSTSVWATSARSMSKTSRNTRWTPNSSSWTNPRPKRSTRPNAKDIRSFRSARRLCERSKRPFRPAA